MKGDKVVEFIKIFSDFYLFFNTWKFDFIFQHVRYF